VYVTNSVYRSSSVTVYARRSDGNAAPLATIAGSNTGLVEPEGVAFDHAGNIYVADEFAGSSSNPGLVLIFAPGANGNVAPIATISQGLNYPFGITLDSSGNVYVGNFQGGSITVYAAQSHQLIRTINRGSYNLYPVGVTLDREGRIYVLDNCICSSGTASVDVFRRHANGNAVPLRTISGPTTGLANAIGGIAVNARHEIYIANAGYSDSTTGVLVFGPHARGNARPERVITGPKTGLVFPDGLSLDDHDRLYVTNADYYAAKPDIFVFDANASGNTPPLRKIHGSKTGLYHSAGLAAH
jgi:hypothetical protein